MVVGTPRKGLKVTYATDTRPVPVIAEAAKDADLFLYAKGCMANLIRRPRQENINI